MTPPRDDGAVGAVGAVGAAMRGERPAAATLLARARQARQLRATMGAFLPRDLLVDPAWDMMIDLYIAAGTGERLCVKDLTLMSGESAASAMRRIDRLQDADLLARHPDRDDHRRVRVSLTSKGHAAMTAMLEHLFDPPDGPGPREAAPPRSFSPDHPRG